MIRNFKRAAVAMACALAATVVLSAPAQGAMTFTAGASSGSLQAVQTSEAVLSLPGVYTGKLRCKSFTGYGTYSSATFTEFEVSPSYSTCLYFGFLSGSFQPNGCKYRYKGETASAATMDVVCPAGKEIVIEVPACTVRIPPQSGRSVVSFTTNSATSPDDVKQTNSVTGLHYTAGPYCNEMGEEKPETSNNGELTGGITLTALKSGGTQVNLTVD